MGYKFKKENRHMTRGIADGMHPFLNKYIWHIIDGHLEAGIELDYLQIFTIQKISDKHINIRHKQEETENTDDIDESFHLELREELPEEYDFTSEKIYVIDDVSHSTMLFADEY